MFYFLVCIRHGYYGFPYVYVCLCVLSAYVVLTYMVIHGSYVHTSGVQTLLNDTFSTRLLIRVCVMCVHMCVLTSEWV